MNALPTIVIVDDSADVRTLVRAQIRLSKRLELVGEGMNGLDAAALASRHQPDLMLLDVSMPVIDGLTALPKVLEGSPRTKVVMYTGFEEAGLGARARDLGASAFVEKSAPFDLLLETLIEIVEADGTGGGEAEAARAGGARPDLDPVLEDHLDRFREVFEDAAIGMATMTLAGRLVRANRSLAQLLDVPVDDLVGVALADLAAEPSTIDDALLSLDAGERVIAVEHRMQGCGERTYRSTLSSVIDSRGRPLYIFLQVQDVSDSEVELRRTEARFRLLVEAVEDYAIFMLDPEGHIDSWNPGAQRSKGYTADEIIGQHFRIFYPPDKQAARHPEHELELALRDGRYEEEGWRVRKDGSMFWANVTITAVRDPDGGLVGFAKVTRDTTERREMLRRQERATDELAEANRRLEDANRQLAEAAEQQAEFFAVTAHELRTPLSVLSGATTTLTEHLESLAPEDKDEIADAVAHSSTQLRRLLDDLLTAARLQARRVELDMSRIDLAEHLHAAVGALRQSSRDADIRITAEPGLHVRADGVRLTQMLENLVLNALRHGRPPVDITVAGLGDIVQIVVADAGEGVTEELQERLFERFATGSNRGTGLGLFLVRELARAHGGDAHYRPVDGAFLLTLPRA